MGVGNKSQHDVGQRSSHCDQLDCDPRIRGPGDQNAHHAMIPPDQDARKA